MLDRCYPDNTLLMLRTVAVLVLLGLLVVSCGGNVLQFQQTAVARAETDRLRGRLQEGDSTRSAIETRVAELRSENERLKAAAPPPVPRVELSPTATLSPPRVSVPQGGEVDRAVLARIEDQVQRLRGLRSKVEIEPRFLDRVELRTFFVDVLDRDYPQAEREIDQKRLVTLGLLAPGESLVGILLALLQDEVLGLYDDQTKDLYVVRDVPAFRAEEQHTYAHEFVHALQDQYFDLASYLPKDPDNEDRALAAQAVVEGDALLMEVLWMQQHLSPEELARMAQGSGGSKMDQAPLYVRTQLLFPYVDGVAFVRQAYQRSGVAAVDELYRTPPDSTEQILHPEKYRAREAPVEVTLPDIAGSLGDGWMRLDGNVSGELDLLILLEQYGDRASAARGSAGWGGDRWELLEQGGRHAYVLATTWDTELDAREFFDAIAQGLERRFSGAKLEEASATRHALSASTAATEVRRDGQRVWMAISFDRANAEALMAVVQEG